MADDQHLTDIRFDSLGLHPALMAGLEKAGFSHCTPIQAETLPRVLAGGDVTGQAQTGTGKTAAFLLGLMNRLLNHEPRRTKATQPRALCLAPTRELAIQIHSDAVVLSEGTGLTLGLAYGGIDYEKQRNTLEEGVDILIGTPGRIIDYFKQGVFDLKAIEVVVLDEADRMFDLGFIKDVRYLLRRMPPPEERLNMLFSATLGQRVHELAYEHMNDAEAVVVKSANVTADAVTQMLYHVESRDKIKLLIGVLQKETPERTLIFVNTKRAAERIEAYLLANGFNAACLTGDVPQKKRQRLIAEFADGRLAMLVATDVAARGLHIPEVSHVINYDLPQNEEDYVHRIGRTARAGESGDAISFACEEWVYSLVEIEKYIDRKIPSQIVPEELLVEPIRPKGGGGNRERRPGGGRSRSGGGGGGGRRGGRRAAGG